MEGSTGIRGPAYRSLWLHEAMGGEPSRPPLEGAARADVAIVGGGYVGLWTALALKEREPDCDVALLEQDICGGGASGRNGGFAISWWPKLGTLVDLCGEADALALARASEQAIGELAQFCEENAIDAHFRRGGHLWTATTPAQLGAWNEAFTLCERLGVHPFERLPDDVVAARTGSPVHLAGILEPSGATVHPGHLVRGLRRAALARGVRIYEGTRVTSISRRYPPVLRTPLASLAAERLVIATNAWAANLRELHRRLAVISSDIVATPPVPHRLAEIGWTGGECISDSQLQIHYYHATRAGRIVFGKGGWGIALAGRIGPSFDRDPVRARDVESDFRRLYPMLSDVPIEYDWSGPIDRSPKGIPLIGHLGDRSHILYAVGWSGNGVAPSLLGGRLLAALALGADDHSPLHALADRDGGAFPPEPVRYVSAHIVRNAVVRKERAEAAGRRPGRLASAVAQLAPAGIIPKRTSTNGGGGGG